MLLHKLSRVAGSAADRIQLANSNIRERERLSKL